MTAPISATPWDLRSGEKWKIESADTLLANDHNNEVIVDAKGDVVAYVSGFNDDGGNGALLAAAPALRDALAKLAETAAVVLDVALDDQLDGGVHARMLTDRIESARAALKQAGQS